jgi:hypothetical protein
MEGSEDKDDKGKPKYVNCREVTAVPATMVDLLPALSVEGAGNVSFDKITKEAMLELNPFLHVNMIMEKSVNFKGSEAEKVLAAIRAEDPSYGRKTSKREEPPVSEEKPAPEMSETEEY